jgi:hypothetical protein
MGPDAAFVETMDTPSPISNGAVLHHLLPPQTRLPMMNKTTQARARRETKRAKRFLYSGVDRGIEATVALHEIDFYMFEMKERRTCDTKNRAQ